MSKQWYETACVNIEILNKDEELDNRIRENFYDYLAFVDYGRGYEKFGISSGDVFVCDHIELDPQYRSWYLGEGIEKVAFVRLIGHEETYLKHVIDNQGSAEAISDFDRGLWQVILNDLAVEIATYNGFNRTILFHVTQLASYENDYVEDAQFKPIGIIKDEHWEKLAKEIEGGTVRLSE